MYVSEYSGKRERTLAGQSTWAAVPPEIKDRPEGTPSSSTVSKSRNELQADNSSQDGNCLAQPSEPACAQTNPRCLIPMEAAGQSC